MTNKRNNKKTIFLQTQLPLVAIFFVAISVYLALKSQSTSLNTNHASNGIGNSCQFVNKTCEFLIGEDVAVARFSDIPIAEESITLSLSLPANSKVESAWIEGINMYMGKIPVLLESKANGEWEGWFMLGSCGEPIMKWQLRLNIKDQETPNYLNFITHP